MTRTGWRRLLVLSIAAVLLLLVARAGLDVWARSRVDAAVARLEQRYGRLHEGRLIAPPVPPGENRARAYRAAVALIDLAPLTNQHGLGLAVTRFLQAALEAPLTDDHRAFVDANRAALRIADEARTRRRSNWEGDYIGSVAGNINMPPWVDVRALSNAIYMAARRDLADGRVDDAGVAIASGLALSASWRHEPFLIAQLIRSAVGLQHFKAVQELVTKAEPSKASLEELARWLAEDGDPSPMDVGLLAELTHFHLALTRFENGEGRVGPMSELPSWADPLAWLGRPLVRLNHARYLDKVGHLLDVQTGPRPRPVSQATPPPSRWLFFTEGIVNIALPGLDRTMDTGDLFTTQRGLAELAVALRRFRIDRGTYPDALSALVPGYVAALPIDASTGQPPVYAREGAGFRLQAEPMKNITGPRAAGLEWVVPK
jgi:hypothetical protein